MKKHITSTAIPTHALKTEALASMSASFERFCLAAGVETLSEMMDQDAEAVCGARHARDEAGGRIDGAEQRARSASTAARSRLSVRAFAVSTARNARCRAGRARSARIGSANGR